MRWRAFTFTKNLNLNLNFPVICGVEEQPAGKRKGSPRLLGKERGRANAEGLGTAGRDAATGGLVMGVCRLGLHGGGKESHEATRVGA